MITRGVIGSEMNGYCLHHFCFHIFLSSYVGHNTKVDLSQLKI